MATIIIKSFAVRNESNTATLLIEQYAEKFANPFWRVLVEYDNRKGFAELIKNGLKNKPNTEQIKTLC